MSLTISELVDKMNPIVGKKQTLAITTNKGLPGLLLETLTGIPHTSNCLDCSDGELKTFPVKRLRNGLLVPKETVAVTMLSTDDLRTCDFESSKCFKKMSRMLMVPYYREGDQIQFMAPRLIDLSLPEFAALRLALKNDYDAIRAAFLADDTLTSSTGVLLQNRTKGAGHGSTSRAFYLRPAFMKNNVPLNL
jgi:DNA mismatch repair protein MutH